MNAWVRFFSVCLLACGALGQVVTEKSQLDPVTDPQLQQFREKVQKAHPNMQVVSVKADVVKQAVLAPLPPPPPKHLVMAIFVKNQSRLAVMDDEVDGVRDRLAAELSGLGFEIMDPAEIASAFMRYKVTTAEERQGLVNGIFSGGSATRVGQMLGADYLVTASIIGASQVNMTAGDRPVSVYTLRMTSKVLDAQTGGSIYGRSWSQKLPTPYEQGSDPMNYYQDLVDRWVADMSEEFAQTRAQWRAPAKHPQQLVRFSVSTTIDQMIQRLEPGVAAAPEMKDQLRQVVGGVVVTLDGATLGSSGGTFVARPGLHQLQVSRQWMSPWQGTVNIQEGTVLQVALELSPEGLQQYGSMENLRAKLAIDYAEAAYRRNVKVNFDSAGWRDVTTGNSGAVIVE